MVDGQEEAEEAGPQHPVVRLVKRPPSLGTPFRWRGLLGSPTGWAPGQAPPLAPWVTCGQGRPLGKEEGQPEDRQAASPLLAPRR